MKVLLTGASSQIGQCLLPMLVEEGYQCTCVSRKVRGNHAGIQWLIADMIEDMPHIWQNNDALIWIHLGFLPFAISHLEAASKAGVKQFIGFSSTSIFTKKESGSDKERQTIQRLIEAESSLQSTCQNHGMTWTLFRPTMIYGCGVDKNISFIQNMIEKFGVFPIAGQGKGLRQPVHAEDLAKACVQVLGLEKVRNKAYNLSGGEVLTYRDMIARIFNSLNQKPRIISINPVIYKCAIVMMKQGLPRYAFLQASMVNRVSMDMCFDHSDASNDFEFDPRRFQP